MSKTITSERVVSTLDTNQWERNGWSRRAAMLAGHTLIAMRYFSSKELLVVLFRNIWLYNRGKNNWRTGNQKHTPCWFRMKQFIPYVRSYSVENELST